MAVDLSDYVPVAERLAKLRVDHPTAVLRTRDIHVEVVDGRSYLVVVAECYLAPDDPLPSIAAAWEPVPGRTPYTKDSELQNAETSAWGRAIVAHLAGDTTRGIASRDDVANRRADEGAPRPASGPQRFALERAIEERGLPDGVPWPLPDDLSMRDASAYLDLVKARERETPPPVRVPTLREDPPESAPTTGAPGAPVPDRPWHRRAFPFDAPPERIAAYWRIMVAAVPGIGDVRLLRGAQDIAIDLGRPVPAEIAEIEDPELVNAVRLWLDARADEKGAA